MHSAFLSIPEQRNLFGYDLLRSAMKTQDMQDVTDVCPKGLLKVIATNAINQLEGNAYAQFAEIILAAVGLSFSGGEFHPAQGSDPEQDPTHPVEDGVAIASDSSELDRDAGKVEG